MLISGVCVWGSCARGVSSGSDDCIRDDLLGGAARPGPTAGSRRGCVPAGLSPARALKGFEVGIRAVGRVVTQPRLRGTMPGTRWPIGPQPCVRVIATWEPDSSMKISRSGSQAYGAARDEGRHAPGKAQAHLRASCLDRESWGPWIMVAGSTRDALAVRAGGSALAAGGGRWWSRRWWWSAARVMSRSCRSLDQEITPCSAECGTMRHEHHQRDPHRVAAPCI